MSQNPAEFGQIAGHPRLMIKSNRRINVFAFPLGAMLTRPSTELTFQI